LADPLLTVCVPTIGRLEYFPLTRRSLENQTFTDYEVLILDNASPESAQGQLKEWADADPRVRILRTDPRIPMFENFNRGIRAARGKYVVFFHDDDMYLPEFLEAYVGMLEKHPSAAIAGGNWDYVGPNGELEEVRRWVQKTELWSGARYIDSLIARGRNMIPMPGLVFRKSALGDGFDTQLPIHFGDFVLLMRLAEAHDVAMISECHVHIRRHTAQASQSMPMSRAVALRTEVMRDYVEEYARRHPHEVKKVGEFRRRIAQLHRIGMVWGWFSAKAPNEAVACIDGLGDNAVDRTMSKALAVAEKSGIRRIVSNSKMIVIARRLGGYLGV